MFSRGTERGELLGTDSPKMIALGCSFDSVSTRLCSWGCVHTGTQLMSCLVSNQDTTLLDQSSTEPLELKGYLNKYTNVAKGYSTRWFVLKQGVLSCKFPHVFPDVS